MIKIGFATKLNRRMSSLQCSSSERLTLMTFMVGSPRLEKQLHHRFASLREWGEWFRPEGRLLDFIEKNIQEQSALKMANEFPEHDEQVAAVAAV